MSNPGYLKYVIVGNPKHMKLLKRGVKTWNDWRKAHEDVRPDLRGIELMNADLSHVDLSRANLKGVNFLVSDLHGADLSYVDLSRANLGGTNLRQADLRVANLRGTYLHEADLCGANIISADLTDADLRDADFTNVSLGNNTFVGNNFSTVKGLEAVEHHRPSSVGIDTLYKSAGRIPGCFLRGCGLSDWQIENAKLYQPELSNEEITTILYQVHELRASQAIQISPLFISYSHADSPFVDKIEAYLNKEGIRFWRDIHHSTAGRLERQIDRAIRLNPTVLLVLSSQSVKSDWVEHEARLARKLEQEMDRDVLCPVALDDSWKTCRWPERLREQIMEYNILDFSKWWDNGYFERMYRRLVEGLNLFYRKEDEDT